MFLFAGRLTYIELQSAGDAGEAGDDDGSDDDNGDHGDAGDDGDDVDGSDGSDGGDGGVDDITRHQTAISSAQEHRSVLAQCGYQPDCHDDNVMMIMMIYI